MNNEHQSKVANGAAALAATVEPSSVGVGQGDVCDLRLVFDAALMPARPPHVVPPYIVSPALYKVLQREGYDMRLFKQWQYLST